MTDHTNWAKVLGELAADHEIACKRQIAEATAPFAARLAELETRPVEKGDPGESGAPGPEGPAGPKGDAGESATNTVVPPELAEQIKVAIHLLHESPPIVQRNAPPSFSPLLPPPRPSRIERTESGGYTLIYDEPQP